MGCNCGGDAKTYQVKYPDGRSRVFLTETEAKVVAAASPGAKVIPVKR